MREMLGKSFTSQPTRFVLEPGHRGLVAAELFLERNQQVRSCKLMSLGGFLFARFHFGLPPSPIKHPPKREREVRETTTTSFSHVRDYPSKSGIETWKNRREREREEGENAESNRISVSENATNLTTTRLCGNWLERKYSTDAWSARNLALITLCLSPLRRNQSRMTKD